MKSNLTWMAPLLLVLTPAGRGAGQDGPRQLSWQDFDGDGLADLLALDGGAPRLWRNLGDGTLQEVGDSSGVLACDVRDASWGDVDGDGAADLLCVLGDGRGVLYRRSGPARFEDATAACGLDALPPLSSARWLDYDQDGHLDLELETAHGVRLLHNDGRGYLEATALAWEGPLGPPGPLGPLGIGPTPPTAAPSPTAGGGGAPAPPRPSSRTIDAGPPRSPTTAGVPGPPRGGESPSARAVATSALGGRRGADAPSAWCPAGIRDDAGGGCIGASSVPTAGLLLPLGPELFVDTDGALGLGTMNPRANVHVRASQGEAELRIDTQEPDGTAKVVLLENDGGGGSLLGGQLSYDGSVDQLRLAMVAGANERVHLAIDRATDNVGINTTSPVSTLHVVGGPNVGSLAVSPDAAGGNKFSELVLAEDDVASNGIKLRFDGVGDRLRFQGLQSGVTTTHVTIQTADGKVGIGTMTPTGRLDVVGDQTGVVNAALRATNTSSGAGNALYGESTGSGTTAILKQLGTGAILKGETSAGTVFQVRDTGRVVTTALEITGGGDLVEGFESDETLTPGTVVAIDAARPGRLAATRSGYDTRVAGVVSGAGGVDHGIRMGQEGVLDGEVLVAMAGRVFVRCSAENGPIRPGDLLTSAALPGHAMRATDSRRAFGAVLGKAMSTLDEGSGLVLVLVNLQ